MNPKRIEVLKETSIKEPKKYVLYWMQQAQRVHYNHALEHAIQVANLHDLPVVVFFGLTANYPEANQRHYVFMLEGLKEVKHILDTFGITFVIRYGSPEQMIQTYLDDAYALIMDKGYMKHQSAWRDAVKNYVISNQIQMKLDLVDTDLIVPVGVASDKAEYGAYTLRPKIKRLYQDFRDFKRISTLKNQKRLDLLSDDDIKDIRKTIEHLKLENSLEPSHLYHGGYTAASFMLFDFLQQKINRYPESNDPSLNLTSKLSMYLHFGQISSLEIMDRLFLALESGQIDGQGFDAYIEQLLVRRELAFNYVYYHQGYDRFEQMTEPWAYQTMKIHEHDQRPYLYTKEDMINFKTHDPYFNAAMKEMIVTGYMHNYMRMYWAKKIIEWMPSFKEAYETILSLNNHYFIDGRDPNSYAGVAWCFGKHDRAWTEREVFGKLRYMNASGLVRKFDIESYVKQVEALESIDD